ncbi:MAG: DUF4252 domain-containing protein [Acidobacteria bacterium]|nr:DUF4252 domain-containing protein [Acidobacteriota bacterium]
MKTVVRHTIKLACLAALVACAAAVAAAQQPFASRLQIENLDALAPKAEKVVDVTLDENLLKLIPAIIRKADKNPNHPDVKRAAQIAAGFKGVYVRSFEFSEGGQWNDSDLASIRAQLKQPGWSRVVSVRTKKDGQNVEVYIMTDPSSVGGLAIVATEPTQLTVVNIVGRISIEDFATIQAHLPNYFPDLGIEIGDSGDKKPETKREAAPATKKP